MEYFRNVLLVVDNESNRNELLSSIPNWTFCDNPKKIDYYDFKLINKEKNLIVIFHKIHDCVYVSCNILPWNTNNSIKICEPQEPEIHDDILFKLCLDIRKKFTDLKVRCGIIPCASDEI